MIRTFYILNNVTLKKRKKELAEDFDFGHKINVQNEIPRWRI